MNNQSKIVSIASLVISFIVLIVFTALIISKKFPIVFIVIPIVSIVSITNIAVMQLKFNNSYGKFRNKGSESTGNVIEIKCINQRTSSYKFKFSFKDDDGKERTKTIYANDVNYPNLLSLTKLPIYVYKKNATINLEKLFNLDKNFNPVSNNERICSCGAYVKPGLLYCPKCGLPVNDKLGCDNEYHDHKNYCPGCGKEVGDDPFCPNCGYKLR